MRAVHSLKKSGRLTLAVLAATALVVAALAGCAPDVSSPDSVDSAASGTGLVAKHVDGQLDGQEYTKKICLSCHSRDTINPATENWGGEEGVNPHASHNTNECIDCHQMEAESVLDCNECHSFTLPEGWVNPPAA